MLHFADALSGPRAGQPATLRSLRPTHAGNGRQPSELAVDFEGFSRALLASTDIQA
jgi:hypothetical protein